MKIILPIDLADRIKSYLPEDIHPVWVDSNGNLDGEAGDAQVYFNGFYPQPKIIDRVLAAAPAIRWQHTPSAGVDRVLTPASLERDIILTNGVGTFAIPIAEFVMAFILNHAKQFSSLQEWQSQRRWKKGYDLRQQGLELQELWDKTVLIIGAGSIGQAIANRAHAFGMRVWGARRNPQPSPGFERVVGANEWRSLVPNADYLVIATPLTPETKGIINADVLRSMRSTAYLINIARGAVIDEAALLTALKEGMV